MREAWRGCEAREGRERPRRAREASRGCKEDRGGAERAPLDGLDREPLGDRTYHCTRPSLEATVPSLAPPPVAPSHPGGARLAPLYLGCMAELKTITITIEL